jgi:hypothetical protein
LIRFGFDKMKATIMKTRVISYLLFVGAFSLLLGGTATTFSAQQKHQQEPSGDTGPNQSIPSMDMDQDMPGMDMGQGADQPGNAGDKDQTAERGAMDAMSHMHHHQMGPHMYMTKLRPASPQDWARADSIVEQLRPAIEKYRDYRVALADNFHIFMPNLPQSEYHFTNYENAFLETFTFDPARPTSLLYKKTKTGWDLIGAMYTMPKRVSEDQLNARVPLSVAQWHLHTNLCMPPKSDLGQADLTKFGLQGSIITKEVCTEAGGTFYPVIFGWMVHVYPFEKTREKIWEQ